MSSGRLGIGTPVSGDAASIGQKLAVVLEQHHTVAEESPPLLGVEGHQAGRVVVRSVRGWALRLVLTHGRYLDP